MPIINVTTKILVPNLKGGYDILKDQAGDEVTLKMICFKACAIAKKTQTIGNGQEVPLSGEEIFDRSHLAIRFYEAKETIDLESKHVTLVKELVAQLPIFNTLVTYSCWQLLEGKPQPGDETSTTTTVNPAE